MIYIRHQLVKWMWFHSLARRVFTFVTIFKLDGKFVVEHHPFHCRSVDIEMQQIECNSTLQLCSRNLQKQIFTYSFLVCSPVIQKKASQNCYHKHSSTPGLFSLVRFVCVEYSEKPLRLNGSTLSCLFAQRQQ